MILIADSGSTKTTWCLFDRLTNEKVFIYTHGINPFYQTEEMITKLLKKEFTSPLRKFESIYFYSAGCANKTVNNIVYHGLNNFFVSQQINIESDLMAVAYALCGHNEGIACILGTGSNSCYFDGEAIIKNISPLGFILGDEGSGAVIGKKFLSDLLKNQLPKNLTELFFNTFKTTPADILNHIYKMPFPNRYAASFTKFISCHIADPSLHKIVKNSFDEFITRNVLQYPQAFNLPIHFSGSIAYYFKNILKESISTYKLSLGNIIKEPMPQLINYHS